MGEKLVVGPINKGLRNDRTAFVIDNDSFPQLINAYQWRGRVKRKRGTSLLNRLQRFFNSASTSYNSGSATFNLVGGSGNLLTAFSLQANGNIIPGSVKFTDSTASINYTDPSKNGTLTGGTGGTINYATGAITVNGGGNDTISTVSFLYFPDLPVLGLEELILPGMQFPGTLGFDTTYSYNIPSLFPYTTYDVSFYKNPAASAPYNYPGYVRKTNTTPTSWNGQTYQQFWTANYQAALWATNGITAPFNITNIGMQYKPIVAVTVTAGGPPAIVNLQITGHGLVIGDFLFINEVVTTTGINFQTGYVTNVVDANNVTVEFPNATIATNGAGGIAQYLTNRSDVTKDCLRWYDGDPTNGSATAPVLNGNGGWVNFAPPLISNVANNFIIDDQPIAQYYLVGAVAIVPFKDRLLFFGPVIQTSAAGSQIYLQDTVIYSQNGTPYYTASFTGSPTAATTVFNPILTPVNQSASAAAYFEDVTGFGGFITAGFSNPITTVAPNEDVLLVGFTNRETRFIYTGNDIVPFNFFVINSEYGSSSTFSSITLDRGVLKVGSRGIILSSQIASERVDLEIPDQIFEFSLQNNGTQRVTAQRDFINEWAYFTYLTNESNSSIYIYPNQTLQFNYRDNSWGIFNETYTTYGQFRRATGQTWATLPYSSWAVWDDPWNAGTSTLFQPQVIAGNQQGFILFREVGTNEGTSLYIQSFSGNLVTAPDHGLNDGDFIIITGCIGTIGAAVNGRIFEVSNPTENMFTINSVPIIPIVGTYFGGGLITRMYVPSIQTKQFPVAWDMSRKTRIGPQQYLLSTTPLGQIELQIFLSQNSAMAGNFGNVVPASNVSNNTLIYSDILYTCPESGNLGLTPANTNLQMQSDPVSGASDQQQIWHRMNTSLIGDTVQIGFTLSNDQMRSLVAASSTTPITGATQANPCVLSCTANVTAGSLVQITGVVGMTQLNGNNYSVVSSNGTTVTINVDSTSFAVYVSGGNLASLIMPNQFAEIELHSFILDVSPSQVLA
jgi:hypothetical protein